MDDSVVVYTDVRRDKIIAERGLGDWVLDPNRAGACKYLVCCRKERWDNVDEGIPKHAAFLVARIKKLVPKIPKNARGQKRFFIQISEYAAITELDVWGDWRNPVRYDSLKGLDLQGGLKFRPVPKAAVKRGTAAAPMTIERAKQELAESLGIAPDQIEITIRS